MGRIILRSFLHLLLLALLVLGWFVFARPVSLLVDKVRTAQVESRSVPDFKLDDLGAGTLRINNLTLNTAGPDQQPTGLRMSRTSAGRLLAEGNGRSITLGQKAGSLGGIHPAAGESARFEVERSLLSWPTPLDLNFMSGTSATWKRHRYYRLSWRSVNGQKLEMLWRFEQWFYPGNGWASGFMTRAGSTGVVRAEILP